MRPSLVLVAFLCACGPDQSDGFDASLLEQSRGWRSVLPSSFTSSGHSGQRVRVTFNATAERTYEAGQVVFEQGALIAKHVVSSDGAPLTEASRVYFMRKEAPGFDPDSNDWSWALAQRSGDALSFTSRGKNPGCTGCHRAQAAWDFAQTVEIYRTQQAP